MASSAEPRRRVNSSGYVVVRAPEHPRAQDGEVVEHLLIAERALGRLIPGKHPVHHVDGDTTNNVNGNLVVCEDGAYHSLLHRRQRALEACGDPSALPCGYCGSYERQTDMVFYSAA